MLYYVGFYSCEELGADCRGGSPAANTKMEYIADALRAAGNAPVEIVTLAGSSADKIHFGRVVSLNDGVQVRCFCSLGQGNKLKRIINYFLTQLSLLYFLLFRVKREDQVVVYHSLYYMRVIALAGKLGRFKLILEVEEIYADVTGKKKTRGRELSFFRCADAYIFPTALLNQTVNTRAKPYILIHGTYRVEPEQLCNLFQDELQDNTAKTIHCVYAGTLDPRKGGAVAAAAAAAWLPSQYHIHILGFGSESDKKKMQELVSEIASRSAARVTYDGVLSGEEYIRFLQSCDIGLSTQNPDAEFNATSFPSKILSYMANGLRVVTIRIPAIEGSAVGDDVFYYDEQTPENVARAVQSADLSAPYDSREKIKQLDVRFRQELKQLLESV